MRRREFVGLLAGTAASWPLAVRAQPAGSRMRRIAVLMSGAEGSAESRARLAAFRSGLEAAGWTPGKSLHIEYRWAVGEMSQIEQHARDLVALKPELIVANGTPVVTAVQKLTKTIPIICALVIDPVSLGFAKTLSRPGGNVTGFTFMNPELIGKWKELLSQAVPEARRSVLVFNPKSSAFYFQFLRELEATHKLKAPEFTSRQVQDLPDLRAALEGLARTPGTGVIFGPDPFVVVNLKELASQTVRLRLPAVSIYRQFVVEGGLMAYGPDTQDIFRRVAGYVDRILKGANPGELPIQQPNKFEFTLNLKTAKSLGLKLPTALLTQADEVIE